MLVEEIAKGANPNSYFTSSVNMSASSTKNRQRNNQINYNLGALESAAHGTKLPSQILEERHSNKRFLELDRENYSESNKIELPKTGITYTEIHTQTATINQQGGRKKQGNTPAAKKILSSRRTLNNYLDEDVNAANVVLNLEANYYQYPQIKLCSICGYKAPSSCVRCGARYCSVKCGVTHNETRCNSYF